MPIALHGDMNTSPEPAHDVDVDAMVHAMRRANRKPLLVGAGVVVALALIGVLYVLTGKAAVASELARRGYSQPVITMNNPFAWGFSGLKGSARCSGTFERIPFSTSISEGCFEPSPPGDAVTKPSQPQHERLEQGLRKQLASLSITGAHCPALEPGATKATCTVEAAAGAPVEVVFSKTGGEWSQDRPERMMVRETLAESLAKDFQGKSKVAITVDCGTGLLGYGQGDALTCTASRKGLKKAGSIAVAFGVGSAYTWTATGI